MAHASLTVELSNLSCHCLSNAHELERGGQHETGAGPRYQSEIRLAHRIRAAFAHGQDRLMLGPIEVDETYLGGKAKNLHASQRDGKRGVAGKYPIVGILDRATGEVRAEAVDDTKKDELQGSLEENVRSDATVYSDEMKSYEDLSQPHEAVQHRTSDLVRGEDQHRWRIPITLSRSGRC